MSKSIMIPDVLRATSLDSPCRRQCQRLMGQILPHPIWPWELPGDVAEWQHPSSHKQNKYPDATDTVGNETLYTEVH